MRREPLVPEAAMQRWVDTNTRIIEFVASHQISCCTVFYDDLTACPDRYFPPLCEFIGVDYESAALEYWNREHHGLGGNGAALNVIGGYERADVTTGDDAFYQALRPGAISRHAMDVAAKPPAAPARSRSRRPSAACLPATAAAFVISTALAATANGHRPLLGRFGWLPSKSA